MNILGGILIKKGFFMKKILLVLVLSVSSIFAYTIISADDDGSDISYYIQCDNGNHVGFMKRKSDGAYFVYGQIVYSMDKALNIACNK